MIDTLRYDKLNGLVPAVVQDADSGEVLMVGFMDRAAVEATLRDGLVTFWSRSRRTLWRKGETSGHTLAVVDVTPDCDRDTLLVRARPSGPTCHTGARSCFTEAPAHLWSVFAELERTVRDRRSSMPEGSYTTSLFNAGTGRIAQKVGEEAVETVVAAVQGDTKALANEAADLIYHLTVLLADRGSTWNDVVGELRKRSGRRS
ncbi:MAG: bifunctional phosphoribosyl-AMP cyclohydrolase/phosphoribosyl-ATP diphosphatase HisIE [Bacteroidetes bacterium]|jgi:phosphoribosyl-ATP pyrophosphohydrolase/phosphoribosyl-AMP cyclohydrolase|nr:bifunctional phosphoribosyl-AMP cyclohydrolase/phosphoribosyl-ATP diphosphatase HisIE [Bacteroidota bacterium]